MTEDRNAIKEQLTGLCTFLVQGEPFSAGDTVNLTFQRGGTNVSGEPGRESIRWLPLTVNQPDREELRDDERSWGDDVVLVRATLAATGGWPRDSMNEPADEYDPEALTLSDVKVLDRSRHQESS